VCFSASRHGLSGLASVLALDTPRPKLDALVHAAGNVRKTVVIAMGVYAADVFVFGLNH